MRVASAPSRHRPRFADILCWAGLAVFTAYLWVVNADYYRADTQIPSYDEAWYLETSLHLYHRLTGNSLGEFWDSYKSAFGVKAPLLAVLPLPWYVIYGAGPYAAMLVNSLFLVMANLYLFLLGRRWFSAEAGLAAVVFYQTMPLACGLSRSFMTEYGLAALVIASLYYLVASDHFSRTSANLALGVTIGLGLLMKVLFAAFIAGPLLLVWLRRRRYPALRRPVAAVVLPALGIAATWYAYNLPALLRFAWTSAYGEVAGQYTAGGLTPWLLLFINQGLSAYYALALLMFGAVALAVNLRHLRSIAGDGRTLVLLAWLLPPLAALAAGRNQLIRFVLPLLPVFALSLAAALFSLGHRWWTQVALALLVAVFPQRLFAAVSYEHPGGEVRTVRWGPFLLYGQDLGWAKPPVREDPWEHRRLLEALRRMAPEREQPFQAVLGVDHVYLNANLLNYLATYYRYPMRFTSLGYGETSTDRAVERLLETPAQFLILAEGFRDLPPFLNRVNHDIERLAAGGELPYRRQAVVPLAAPIRATLYELDSPWERFAPGAAAPAPTHPQVADPVAGLRFLGYDWKRRSAYLWELTCYWTAVQPLGEDYSVRLSFFVDGHLARKDEHFIALGRHPLSEWQPGEVVRETRLVYWKAAGAGDARLELVRWGIGPAEHNSITLRLAP